jgi:hypothetical protein
MQQVDGINLLPHLTSGASIANRKPLLLQQLYIKMQSFSASRPKPYATNGSVEVVFDAGMLKAVDNPACDELANIPVSTSPGRPLNFVARPAAVPFPA